ncbi:glycosyltransferase family 2 protein [bacterium]|nr:glycosyltransferase family 2 protein [bacterium]
MDVSFVIPVFNEEGDLRQLHSEISEVMEKTGLSYEIFFINDGSKDTSWEIIKDLAESDGKVRGVCFRRNFGKSEALSAGFKRVSGKYVFTMDADLQDDPHEIPAFLEMMKQGYDLVSGWKQTRHDPLEKRLPSKLFNATVSYMTGVRLHDFNCGFKCYTLECAKEIDCYGERHRFMPALANERGFKVGELVVNHRARIHGRSKFGFERYMRGFMDLLTVTFLATYTRRPAHLLGGLGVLALFLGFLLMAVSTLLRFRFNPFFAVLGLALFILGGQAVIMGLVSELIVARSRTPQKTIHSVKEEF